MPSNPLLDRPLSSLWLIWLLPVGAWGGHLLASYALIEWYCQHLITLKPETVTFFLLGLTLLAVGIALFGLILAWRLQRRFKSLQGGGAKSGRRLFMARIGILLGLLGILLIVAEGVPVLVLSPCAS